MQITLNIGLNVGQTEPENQLNLTLDLIKPVYWRIVSGQYEGMTERTIVAVIHRHEPLQAIFEEIAKLCLDLRQECIAVSIDMGEIVLQEIIYSPYYIGKRLTFDPAYFHGITLTGALR